MPMKTARCGSTEHMGMMLRSQELASHLSPTIATFLVLCCPAQQG